MKRLFVVSILMFVAAMPLRAYSGSGDPAKGEEKVFEEFKGSIPQERIKSPDDLYKIVHETKDGGKVLVVEYGNSRDEFDHGHVNGSHLVVKPYEVPETWPDPDTEIWVVSRSERGAAYLAGFLYNYGYKEVYLVKGGIAAWIEKGYPLVNKYLGLIKVTKAGPGISRK